MPAPAPSPYGPGRWIRWALGPFWLVLAAGALALYVKNPTTTHLVMTLAYAAIGAVFVALMVHERRLLARRDGGDA